MENSTFPPILRSHHNLQCVFWQEVAAENMLRKWLGGLGGDVKRCPSLSYPVGRGSGASIFHNGSVKYFDLPQRQAHLNLPSSYVAWNFYAGAYFIGILYEICGQQGILSEIFILNFSTFPNGHEFAGNLSIKLKIATIPCCSPSV